MNIRVLNDPAHICRLPDPAAYLPGTDVICEEVAIGGRFTGGTCGREYTRTTRFGRPCWAGYDYGW